jgi:hypothetical protein
MLEKKKIPETLNKAIFLPSFSDTLVKMGLQQTHDRFYHNII